VGQAEWANPSASFRWLPPVAFIRKIYLCMGYSRYTLRATFFFDIFCRSLLFMFKKALLWVICLFSKCRIKCFPLLIQICFNPNMLSFVNNSRALHPQVYDIGEGKLSYEYVYKNRELMEDRLLKAGYHLAAMLNDIFS